VKASRILNGPVVSSQLNLATDNVLYVDSVLSTYQAAAPQ